MVGLIVPRPEAVWKVGGHLGTISVQQSLGNSIKEVEISINFVEPVMGIEPATCCLRNSSRRANRYVYSTPVDISRLVYLVLSV